MRWLRQCFSTFSHPHRVPTFQPCLGLIKESADLWRKHGAQVSVWSVQVGEVGNMVFACRFDSSAQLGATLDAVNADPAFAAWRVKNIKAGLASWVRSNQAYEIPI
jgi:hypothetical protein